ncbi:MAG TPA: squalene synthase HpnC [Gaiellaceae bacterium]|nr:squalene synthase HpnC [Gaiellaceae bacterium]
MPAAEAVRRRASTENFSVASLLLGSTTRRRLMAVYGFARLVDELGDAVEGDRLAALDEAEAELDRAFTGEARTPLFQEVEALIRDCRVRREPFARLIEANRRDQAQFEYETWADLVSYCELSANPVGRLVLAVFGVETPERGALSDDVCTALQVVEHVQDVREDALAGRIYMPGEDRRRHGVERDDLTAATPGPGLRALLELQCERARGLLRSGRPLVGSLEGRARFAVAGYVGGGIAALDALRDAGYDVLSRAPRPSRATRLRTTLAVLRSAR